MAVPETPEGYDELIREIDGSHMEATNNAYQEKVLRACVNFLYSNQKRDHWFCDPHTKRVAVHALILFSFVGNEVLDWLRPRISNCISGCEKCAVGFYEGISQTREDFLIKRSISVKQVDQFLQVILSWRAKVLFDDHLLPFLEDSSHLKIPFTVMSEALICPDLLRSNDGLRQSFPRLLELIHSKGDFGTPSHLLAGAIYMTIDGDADTQSWALQWLETLRTSEHRLYSEGQVSRLVVDELSKHLYRVQDAKFFTPKLCFDFWTLVLALLPILTLSALLTAINTPYDIEVMAQHINIRLYPLLRVFVNHLLAQLNEPVPVLLKVFEQLLKTLRCDFWENIKPYIFINVLDAFLVNPHYIKFLADERVTYDNHKHSFSGRGIDWIAPFLGSLTEIQHQNASIRLGQFLFNNSPDPSNWNPEVSKNPTSILLLYMACNILRESLGEGAIDLESKMELVIAEMVKRRDVRAVIDEFSNLITHLAFLIAASDEEIRSIPRQLVFDSLSYDCCRLSINSKLIQLERTPSYSEAFMRLVDLVVDRKIYLNPELIGVWLGAFNNACQIVQFEERKHDKGTNKEFLSLKQKHNNQVEEFNTHLRKFLETASLADPVLLRAIFEDENAQAGFWSCLFSSLLSLSAANILYEMFDVGVGGRLEAIKALFTHTFSQTLTAISGNLEKLTYLEAFESCPKTVKIHMDVLKVLTDPLADHLSLETHPGGVSGGSKDIKHFWSASWHFLEMIYKRTLSWANFYPLSQLLEFARDTLDLSHTLLDSFRLILQSINDNLEEWFFSVFFNVFNSMIVWLRLGDPALLNSCVELVFKGFALAKDMKLKIDVKFIDSFARYGAKAKKFNNKLTEQQRSDILSMAREFNYELVELIVEEVQRQRNKETAPGTSSTPRTSPAPEEDPEVVEVSSRYAYQMRGPKQQSLARFGVVTSQPPVAPPPPQTQFKSASLEAIRQDLLASRSQQPKVNHKPPVVVAAARPAGFNPRKAPPLVGRSLNSLKRKVDSDSEVEDEDDEHDVDVSDLFVDKKKKAKIVELDINGRPVVKPTRVNKVDQKRREEENMRMRLNVNLKPLYSTILKWNYSSTDAYPTADKERYKETKKHYDDVKDYIRTMEPLVMLECWQSILSSKETSQEAPFTMLIGSRTSIDGFFDVYASLEKKILADRKITDSDLLVLTFIDNATRLSEKELGSALKSPTATTCLAKVREIKSANADFSDVTFRVYPQGTMMSVLTPKSVVVGMKVMQMITIEREYLSLRGLEYYNLRPEILEAVPAPPVEVSEKELSHVVNNYNVNRSQALAIASTHNRPGFSLIQGPPGTGKTKTILGIVGYNLSKDVPQNVIEIEGEQNKPPKRSKILVCAPSNAAVDELVIRLRDGVYNHMGELINPAVVRLGRSDAVNAAVRDLTLEELVEKHLLTRAPPEAKDPSIRAEHTQLVQERNTLRKSLQGSDLSEEQLLQMEQRLREVNKRRNELAKKLDEQRENAAVAYRSREMERRQLQAKILNESQIICSTLSGSAHDFLSSLSMTFDKVIIDEACQCVELSAIIPLRYGCTKCIMVGDPKQLPPTVLSQTAASLNYDQSLFVRMQQQHPDSAYLLDIQYRMHPEISSFPSVEFYRSRLHDGAGMLEKNTRPWHSELPYSPYRFFDIVGKHQKSASSRSLFNRVEAEVVLELVEHLMTILPPNKFKGRVGVISPYKEQIRTLKNVFEKKFGRQISNEIDFNTVDGYQGQEKEIIIMSCVRASETGNVGFLSDVRRMNVALTRARTTLWILGNAESLSRNKVWARLLNNAKQRNLVTGAKPGFLKHFSSGAAMQKLTPRVEDFAQAKETSKKSTFQPTGPTMTTSVDKNAAHLNDQPQTNHTPILHASIPEAKSSSIFGKPSENKNGARKSAGSTKRPRPYVAPCKPFASDSSGTIPLETTQANGHSDNKHRPEHHDSGPSNAHRVLPTSSGVISKPKPSSSIFINNRRKRR